MTLEGQEANSLVISSAPRLRRYVEEFAAGLVRLAHAPRVPNTRGIREYNSIQYSKHTIQSTVCVLKYAIYDLHFKSINRRDPPLTPCMFEPQARTLPRRQRHRRAPVQADRGAREDAPVSTRVPLCIGAII